MFGSNYNISIFIKATESMDQMKWWADSKVALKNIDKCSQLRVLLV